eukprot:GGOE01014506.1.p1 GENE.GGOE01014506.1~~GGOE01014506.1.p1  ORF type:complete len:569 (-),score=161.11 GGOE01014506.1:310-1800(-)
MSGTGGGVALRCGGGDQQMVYSTASGLQKEDMVGADMFTLAMDSGAVLAPEGSKLKCSSCKPLWLIIFRLRPKARAIIHTHSKYAQLASMLGGDSATEFRITHLEMIKGVGGHAYDDELVVPIIHNRPSEELLSDQIEAAVQAYPKCNGVLVRRHGLFVWGDSWQQAKAQCECFDYLFETAVFGKILNIDFSKAPEAEATDSEVCCKRRRLEATNGEEAAAGHGFAHFRVDPRGHPRPCPPQLPADSTVLLLDIEGTTTKMSFVYEELFPYARRHCQEFLEQYWEKPELQSVLDLMRVEATHDVQHPEQFPRARLILGPQTKEEGVASVLHALEWQMDMDRKATGLKALQGLIWADGYRSGELQGHVYQDAFSALCWWKENGVQVYVHSSGSIAAQKLLFRHTPYGNLLPLLAGHFDMASGPKDLPASYEAIAKQIGVPPGDIVFLTDSEKELVAAREAGIGWPVICCRQGNRPLTADSCGLPAVRSMLELCRCAD